MINDSFYERCLRFSLLTSSIYLINVSVISDLFRYPLIMSVCTRKADTETEYLVFGYTRSIVDNVPDEVSNICLSFYFEYDQWDISLIHPSLTLKEDQVTIEHTDFITQSANACLTKEFESGQHEWKFEIVKLNKDVRYNMKWARISIGIFDLNSDESAKNHMEHLRLFKSNYQVISRRNLTNNRDLQIGDIVEFSVDFNRGLSRFQWKINDINFSDNHHVIFVWNPSKYRVAVNFYVPGDSIKLL